MRTKRRRTRICRDSTQPQVYPALMWPLALLGLIPGPVGVGRATRIKFQGCVKLRPVRQMCPAARSSRSSTFQSCSHSLNVAVFPFISPSVHSVTIHSAVRVPVFLLCFLNSMNLHPCSLRLDQGRMFSFALNRAVLPGSCPTHVGLSSIYLQIAGRALKRWPHDWLCKQSHSWNRVAAITLLRKRIFFATYDFIRTIPVKESCPAHASSFLSFSRPQKGIYIYPAGV